MRSIESVLHTSWVALASLFQQVTFPALRAIRIHVIRAERAADGAGWVGRCTMMPLELVDHEDLLALRVVLVLAHVGALLQKMLLNHLDFNDLVALPATCQNRAFFPVVDIQGLVREVGINSSTEITLLGAVNVPRIAHFVRVFGLTLVSWSATTAHRLLRATDPCLLPCLAYIGLDCLSSLLLLLRLFGWSALIFINFLEL